jgi:plasmid replication initiation protein
MPKGPDAKPQHEAALQAINQLDLFTALPGDLPTHDQQEMMERPFFSLSKGKRIEPIDYHVRNGTTDVRVRVTANADTGMATIWDADILIWAASQVREAMIRGVPTSRKFRVSLYELLRWIGRPTGGSEYARVVEALRRLKGTVIETTIRQKGTRPQGFGWIEEWSAPTDENGKSLGIEFTIADWLFQGVRDDKLVLSIDRDYFALTGGIERWLYGSCASTAAIRVGAGVSPCPSSTTSPVRRGGWRTSPRTCARLWSGRGSQATGLNCTARKGTKRRCASRRAPCCQSGIQATPSSAYRA